MNMKVMAGLALLTSVVCASAFAGSGPTKIVDELFANNVPFSNADVSSTAIRGLRSGQQLVAKKGGPLLRYSVGSLVSSVTVEAVAPLGIKAESRSSFIRPSTLIADAGARLPVKRIIHDNKGREYFLVDDSASHFLYAVNSDGDVDALIFRPYDGFVQPSIHVAHLLPEYPNGKLAVQKKETFQDAKCTYSARFVGVEDDIAKFHVTKFDAEGNLMAEKDRAIMTDVPTFSVGPVTLKVNGITAKSASFSVMPMSPQRNGCDADL